MFAIDNEIEKLELLKSAKLLQAFLECSEEIQAGIREVLAVVHDPETDEDDREMALFTLADALFPNFHEGKLGMDLARSEQLGAQFSNETKDVVEQMDAEEANFAERLRKHMDEQNLTQIALAEKVGLGQPAISNMLNRQCRPQRQTVLRFAQALNVQPDELWPGFTAESR